MIIVQDGHVDLGHCVRAEIEPGRWWFHWWYEISVWRPDHKLDDGTPSPCWEHWWQYDGAGWGLWHTWAKAQEAVMEVSLKVMDEKK